MKKTITLLLLVLFSKLCFAQKHYTQQEAEKQILEYLKEMKHWKKKKKEYSTDSVYAVNRRLLQLMSDIGYDGFTLNADFSKLEAAGMEIHTSDDNMVRTFCWEILNYGTIHYYNNMITYYQSATRAMSFTSKDGTALTDIRTLHTMDSNTVYLIREENQYDYRNRYSRYVAHVFNMGYFTIKTFFFNNADSQAYAGYSYKLSSFSAHEQGLPSARLSKDKNEFIVPVVGDGGIYNGTDLIYKFDGKRFVYDSYTENGKVKK